MTEHVRVWLLCIPREQRAAYLLADVVGLTDVEGADIVECSRDAFRQRVSRARRSRRYVIDNRCGLVDTGNPCRCGRQAASRIRAGILDADDLPLAQRTTKRSACGSSGGTRRLDHVVAIGDLYRFDRFTAPAALWAETARAVPELLDASY